MPFSLLMLATPRIGPPPNVWPARLELEIEFCDDDPFDDDPFSFASEFPEELSDEPPADAFPELPPAEFWLPGGCSPPGCAPKPPTVPTPPVPAPNPPAPGPPPSRLDAPPCRFVPGVCPRTIPLFRLMSC